MATYSPNPSTISLPSMTTDRCPVLSRVNQSVVASKVPGPMLVTWRSRSMQVNPDGGMVSHGQPTAAAAWGTNTPSDIKVAATNAMVARRTIEALIGRPAG